MFYDFQSGSAKKCFTRSRKAQTRGSMELRDSFYDFPDIEQSIVDVQAFLEKPIRGLTHTPDCSLPVGWIPGRRPVRAPYSRWSRKRLPSSWAFSSPPHHLPSTGGLFDSTSWVDGCIFVPSSFRGWGLFIFSHPDHS